MRIVHVTCYILRRKRRRDSLADPREFTYEVWVVYETRTEDAPDGTPPRTSVDPALSAGEAGGHAKRLRDALAGVSAGRLEDMIWRSADDLSEDEVAGLLANFPDTIKALAAKPVESLAEAASVPAPAASFGADVTVTFLLDPVLEPVENAVHGLEVAGIVIGLLIGPHALAVTCIKHLAHDLLGKVLTSAVNELISNVSTCTVDGPQAVAAGPAQRPADLAARTVVNDADAARPQLATRSARSAETGTIAVPVLAPPGTMELFDMPPSAADRGDQPAALDPEIGVDTGLSGLG